MAVRTDAPEVVRVRRGVLQLTLDMLPEGDPALLRELATAVATHRIIRGRFLPERPLPMQETVDASNPFWLLDRTRCILCQRCVDACQHVQHIDAIALLNRSLGSEIGVFRHGLVIDSNCTSCGQCWATCPARYPAEDAANRERIPTLIPVPAAANGPCDALGSRGSGVLGATTFPRLPVVWRRRAPTAESAVDWCSTSQRGGSSFRSTTYRRTNRARECSVSRGASALASCIRQTG